MGKSKTPEERAAKEARKLERLTKKSKKEASLNAATTLEESSAVASVPTPTVPEAHVDVAMDGHPSEKHKKEKKPTKKRRLEPEEGLTDPATTVESSEAPKRRKKQKRTDNDELADIRSMAVDDIPHTELLDVVEEEASVPSSRSIRKEKAAKDKKGKKERGEDGGNPAHTVEEHSVSHDEDSGTSPISTGEKKRKEKKQKSTDTTTSPKTKKKKPKLTLYPTEPGSPSPPKTRKNRTGFPDPRADESLNDQARKALDYAFVQFNNPPNWKFNKAKQNWLIRNVWSTEAIPDSYLPLAMKYLTQVQGGSRDKLKQTCEAALSEPVPSPARTGDDAKDPQPSDLSGEANDRSAEPKSILKPAKPVAGAIIASLEPPVTVESKIQRAKLLLDALGFSN